MPTIQESLLQEHREKHLLKRKRKSRTVATAILSVALLAFIAYNLYSAIFLSISTELVYAGAIEDVVNANGYIIRTEEVINAPANGTLVYDVAEESRVHVGMSIASVIQGDVDESAIAQYKALDERIRHYEAISDTNYYTDEGYRIEYQVEKRVRNIIEASYNQQDLGQISTYKDEIVDTLAQDVPGMLSELKAQRDSIAALLPKNRTRIYATEAGVFSSNIDGYEEAFSIKVRSQFTPEYLQAVTPDEVAESIEEGEPCLKIINNYKFYIAAIIDTEWADDLGQGDEVTLRFPYINNESAVGVVDSIIKGEDGKATLIIACTKTLDSVFRLREINVDIIKATYIGLRIPTMAIQEKDGVRGVYIVRDRQMRFRPIDILYENELHTVVRRDDYSLDQILFINNEIVVRAYKVEDGLIVR